MLTSFLKAGHFTLVADYVKGIRNNWQSLVVVEACIWLVSVNMTFRESVRRNSGPVSAKFLFDRPGFVETVLSHSIDWHVVAAVVFVASQFFRWQWRRRQRTKRGPV